MAKRSAVACALFAAVIVAMVTSLAGRAAYPSAEHLTFNAPVALPGVTLVPGEYEFQVNYIDAGNVVQVHQRDSRRLMFQGMTNRVQRPVSRRAGTVILGEARSGEAAPVLVWYPTATALGFQFLYAR